MHKEVGKTNIGNQIRVWIYFFSQIQNENISNAVNVYLACNAYATCKWKCSFQMSMHIQDVYFYTNRIRTYGQPITVYQQAHSTPETMLRLEGNVQSYAPSRYWFLSVFSCLGTKRMGCSQRISNIDGLIVKLASLEIHIFYCDWL